MITFLLSLPGLAVRHRVAALVLFAVLASAVLFHKTVPGRCAQVRRRVYARMEDQALILAPQRTGKSGLIADRILSHPGAVLATSTRADLAELQKAGEVS